MAEKKLQQEPQTNTSAAKEEDKKSPAFSLTETITRVSGLVASVAGVIYLLGLVALWAPIARIYTDSISAAASVVALVPKTEVAGQGIAIIIAPAVLTVFTGVVLSLLLHVYRYLVVLPLHRLAKRSSLIIEVVVMFVSIACALLLAEWLTAGRWLSWVLSTHAPAQGSGSSLVSYLAAGSALFFILGAASWIFGLTRAVEVKERLIPSIDWRMAFKYLSITLAFTAVAAGLQGAAQDPPLYTVTVSETTNQTVDGDLLAHTDRFWYVFDSEKTLLAIPDSQVRNIRLCTWQAEKASCMSQSMSGVSSSEEERQRPKETLDTE
jgi:hypothetical protein